MKQLEEAVKKSCNLESLVDELKNQIIELEQKHCKLKVEKEGDFRELEKVEGLMLLIMKLLLQLVQ